MSKRTEEKLRREIEILKAQIKSAPATPKHQEPVRSVDTKEVPQQPKPQVSSLPLDERRIKVDLIKTLVFSFLILGTLLALHFTEARWVSLIKFL